MSKKKFFFIFGFCLIILASDAILKAYTTCCISPMRWSSSVYPYGGVPVFQNCFGVDFSLNYVTNKGAAWGVFSGFQEYLLYARFLIMGGILFYLIFSKMTFVKKFFLSLVFAGALGNIVDFFIYKHVVDMFLFCFWGYFFPVFNIADSAIFCGVVFLLFQGFFEKTNKNFPEVL